MVFEQVGSHPSGCNNRRNLMPLTPHQIAVLERFRPSLRGPAVGIRLWHILTAGGDQVLADEMVALGLLDRRSQRRKGFPPLYLITDAGMAALPAVAPDQVEPSPQQLLGHVSPPRGRAR